MAGARRTHNLDNAFSILQGSMDTALKAGGLILKKKMQEFSPLLTGRMQRSVSVGDVKRVGDALVLRVGPTVDYAKFTEEEPYIIGKRPGPKSQAKGAKIPWMKPAAKAVRGEVIGVLRRGVSTTIRGLQASFR